MAAYSRWKCVLGAGRSGAKRLVSDISLMHLGNRPSSALDLTGSIVILQPIIIRKFPSNNNQICANCNIYE